MTIILMAVALAGCCLGAYQHGRRRECDLWIAAINADEVDIIDKTAFARRILA